MSNAFNYGYEYVVQNLAGAGAYEISQEWIDEIENAIDYEGLEKAMIELADQKNSGEKQLQGFIAELWHTRTFNTNATINESGSVASMLDENGYGSVDVRVNSAEGDINNFSLKYYGASKGGSSSVHAQSETPYQEYMEKLSRAKRHGKTYISEEEYMRRRGISEEEFRMSKYLGQGKVIPVEQAEDAREYLISRIAAMESKGDLVQASRYKEVLESIDFVVKDGKGTESLQLTHEQALELARAAKKGNIDDELFKQCGLDINKLVSEEEVFSKAMSAGLNAAAMSFIISMAPVVINGVMMLISEDELDSKALVDGGLHAVSATARAFVTGSLTALIVAGCKSGKFGEEYLSINTKTVSTLVVVAVGTVNIALKLATGKIDKTEMVKEMMQLYIVAASSYIGAITLSTILNGIPFAYMLGSMIGGIVGGFVYKGVDYLLLSYCVESGCTFFGLVEQDYALPKDVLEDIGLDEIEFDKLEIDEFKFETFMMNQFNFENFNYETINIHLLRRDLIGVSTVGYV